MKAMTCKQLGGACDKEFQANSFEDMMELVKAHGMEMFQTGDAAHFEAMAKVQAMMQSPDDMQEWLDEKRQEFESIA